MTTPFVPPTQGATAFNCPRCGAYAAQAWGNIGYYTGGGFTQIMALTTSLCVHCRERTLWRGDGMLYPPGTTIEEPNQDLPDEIQTVYREAASVIDVSPRSSAALLRLCIQMLCAHLGEEGNLDGAIASLVKRGLPQGVQKALDVVRVVGNNAVHPGVIDISDDRERAAAMFMLVNSVAQAMLTHPREVASLYEDLPEGIRSAIDARDRRSQP